MQKRLQYLDAAKGWGILMVMFGHITPLSSFPDRYFGSYKIALFFVASGYAMAVFGSLERYEWREYARKHFKSLMVPFFATSLLLLPFTAWLDTRTGRTGWQILERLLGMVFKMVSLRGYSSLWFLPCLFLAQLFFFHAMKGGWARRGLWLMASLLAGFLTGPLLAALPGLLGEGLGKAASFVLLSFGRGLFGVVFLMAGFWGAKGSRRLPGRGRPGLGLLLWLFGLWLTVAFSMPSVNYNEMEFGRAFPLVLVCGIASSLGLLFFLEALEGKAELSLLPWTGRNGLVILATHVTFQLKYLAYLGYDALFHVAEKVGPRYYFDIVCVMGLTLLFEAGLVAALDRVAFLWKRKRRG